MSLDLDYKVVICIKLRMHLILDYGGKARKI